MGRTWANVLEPTAYATFTQSRPWTAKAATNFACSASDQWPRDMGGGAAGGCASPLLLLFCLTLLSEPLSAFRRLFLASATNRSNRALSGGDNASNPSGGPDLRHRVPAHAVAAKAQSTWNHWTRPLPPGRGDGGRAPKRAAPARISRVGQWTYWHLLRPSGAMDARNGSGRTSSSSSSDSDALSALSSSSEEPVTVGAVGGWTGGWGWSAAVAARNSAFHASIICLTFSRSSGASSSKFRTSSWRVIVFDRRQALRNDAKTHSRWYQRVLPWPSLADGGRLPMRASPALRGRRQSTDWHFERSSQACVDCFGEFFVDGGARFV